MTRGTEGQAGGRWGWRPADELFDGWVWDGAGFDTDYEDSGDVRISPRVFATADVRRWVAPDSPSPVLPHTNPAKPYSQRPCATCPTILSGWNPQPMCSVCCCKIIPRKLAYNLAELLVSWHGLYEPDAKKRWGYERRSISSTNARSA